MGMLGIAKALVSGRAKKAMGAVSSSKWRRALIGAMGPLGHAMLWRVHGNVDMGTRGLRAFGAS